MKKLSCLSILVLTILAFACDSKPDSTSEAVIQGGDSTADTSIPAGKLSASDSTARIDTAVKRFFRGTGTEPFWSLSVDFTKSIIFKDVEGKEIEVPAVKGEKAMDANVVRYASKGLNGNLVVQIAKQECINDMSGQKFDYTVTIDVQEKGKPDIQTYKGCGRYLSVDTLSK